MKTEIRNITISQGEFEDRIELRWDIVEGAVLYAVYRRVGDKDFELLARDLTEGFFVDYDVDCDVKYEYAVKFRDSGGWSDPFMSEPGFIREGVQTGEEGISDVRGRESKARILTVGSFFAFFAFFAVFYTLFLTNVEYVSETKIILKESSVQPSPSSLMAIVNPSVGNQRQNIKVLETFLRSREMFGKLDERFDLRGYFGSSNINFYERLSEGSSIEDFLALYDSKIDFIYDAESDIVNISFFHTDSQKAQEILAFINEELLGLINELNKRTSEKKLRMINEVIETARKEYEEQRQALEIFQSQYRTISPKDDLFKRVELTLGLEKEIERLDNEIREKSTYMNEDYFEVKNLKQLKKELENKLDQKLAGMIGVDKNKVNLIINNFEELRAKLKLQEVIVSEAVSKQANMRIELQKEKLIMEVITSPTLGEEYARPVKLHNVILVITLSFMFYFIFNVVSTIIREKRY